MDTVKISEHLARMGEQESRFTRLLNGAYVRDTDNVIIYVKNGQVLIGSQEFELETRENQVFFGEFVLTKVTDAYLAWDHEDSSTVLWKKRSEEHLREISAYLLTGAGYDIKLDSNAPKVEANGPISAANVHTDLRVSPKDVNEMITPTLLDIDLLALHIETFEELARSLQIVRIDTRGQPIIDDALKVAFVQKLADSVRGISDLETTIRQNMAVVKYDFAKLKDLLLRNYCTPGRLRASIRRRINELHFDGPNHAETFLNKTSIIFSIITRLSTSDWSLEYVLAVAEIMPKLKMDIFNKIHDRMCDLANDETRWELAIPFDEVCKETYLFRAYTGRETVVELIRRRCERQLERGAMQTSQRIIQNQPSPTQRERVNLLHEISAEEYARQFLSAFVVFPRKGTSSETVMARLEESGMHPKRYLSRKETPFFVVGSPFGAEESSAKLRAIENVGMGFREFNFHSPKNSAGDPHGSGPQSH